MPVYDSSKNNAVRWRAIYNNASVGRVRSSRMAVPLIPPRHSHTRTQNLALRSGPVRPRSIEKEQPRPRGSGRTADPLALG
jgi:hypothetical protein